MHNLTRAEVARRLGKSIATVRRLEYRALFPVRDERGVLRFAESDVERLRNAPASIKPFARSPWFERNVLERARRSTRVPTGPSRRSSKAQPDVPDATQLANDLQTALGALLARFDGKRLRTCGFDADLFARAFDAVRRLRALGSP